MNVNVFDGNFSADCFALGENNQPVCTDQFLHGLQVLAGQATLAISNPEAVEQAFERIQEAQWGHICTEAKKIVDQRIQKVRQEWVKLCFSEQFRHIPREHLKKNCGLKFQAQYSSKMKDSTAPKLVLLPPEGVSEDVYDQTIVKAFLDYFQTGTLLENALNASILDLLSLAHLHQIEELITKCTEFLKEQFDDHENLDTVLEFANKQKITQLTIACLSYMQANRDKISAELKEKYEKTLPVVKALFKNEIILNHLPSGNVEVRVEIFNEETASHIEQLSKLFTIRTLVISEERTDKLLNNSEQLFPFLKVISPMLKKDLQELIIWNETPEEEDFLILKTQFATNRKKGIFTGEQIRDERRNQPQMGLGEERREEDAPCKKIIFSDRWQTGFRNLFPNLTTYGNDAPFLKTFEEVKTYLTYFRNPDEDDPESEKLVLRSLNLSSLSTFDDVQMAEITPHFKELYRICIKSDNITSIAAPKATVIDCNDCLAITTILAHEATVINCGGCTALTTLEAPKATEIYSPYCTTLTTIEAPKATVILSYNCVALKTLDAPKATKIICNDCTALKTLDAPEATEVRFEGCKALKTLNAPKAIDINCDRCTALKTLDAPEAIEVNRSGCTALKTINAPKIAKINYRGCKFLTTVKAPRATEINCGSCVSLTTIEAPEAIKIYCNSCLALTTLQAPEATEIHCNSCTSLTTLEAPKATQIYCNGCEALTTIVAPKATVIDCRDCLALTTLIAPKATGIDCLKCKALRTITVPEATKIHCQGCRSLITLISPKATDINCYLCAALKTINAPEATKIFCSGCTALTTLIAPKATQIDCNCCTSLTTLNAPNATQIYCRGCPKLKPMIAT